GHDDERLSQMDAGDLWTRRPGVWRLDRLSHLHRIDGGIRWKEFQSDAGPGSALADWRAGLDLALGGSKRPAVCRKHPAGFRKCAVITCFGCARGLSPGNQWRGLEAADPDVDRGDRCRMPGSKVCLVTKAGAGDERRAEIARHVAADNFFIAAARLIAHQDR